MKYIARDVWDGGNIPDELRKTTEGAITIGTFKKIIKEFIESGEKVACVDDFDDDLSEGIVNIILKNVICNSFKDQVYVRRKYCGRIFLLSPDIARGVIRGKIDEYVEVEGGIN